jgi:integrase
VQGSQQLLRDYLKHWIDTEVGAKQSTIDDYHKRGDLYIYPTLGDMRLCDLKRREVVAWINGMMNTPDEKGRYWSRESIKQAVGLLRRALDAAVPELLEYNPAAGVKVPPKRKGYEFEIDKASETKKIFTPDELRRVLDELWRTNESHQLYVYFVLLAELGLRRGEGLGVRRKDVDFLHATVVIAQQVNKTKAITTTKNDTVRDLPISIELATLLKEQCLLVGAANPNDLLFPNKAGAVRRPDSVTQLFRRTCNRLGFFGYTLHSIRHHRVTDWRTKGVDLEVTAALAGHKGVKVTAEIYSHATMERKRAAVEKGRKAE